MIVLDTNVMSELMETEAHESVLNWYTANEPRLLVTTAIAVAEIYRGIAILPHGRKRRSLQAQAEATLSLFAGRILVFDEISAHFFADVSQIRKSADRPISMGDAMIAAICRQHDLTLATRNVRDFEETGITVVNPWGSATDLDDYSGMR